MVLKARDIQEALSKSSSESMKGQDVWLTDTGEYGAGRLRLRFRNGSMLAYFRYSAGDLKVQLPLHQINDAGQLGEAFGKREPKTLDDCKAVLAEAQDLYRQYAKLYRQCAKLYPDHPDLRGWLDQMAREHAEAQMAQEQAMVEAERREREAADTLATKSLAALLAGYVAHLKAKGKTSAREAGNLFTRNVIEAFPQLVKKPAKDITHQDIGAVLAKTMARVKEAAIEKGIDLEEGDVPGGRTAGKVRAFLGAAFAAAMGAEFDATIHPDLHGFGLTANPVLLIKNADVYKAGAGERTLNQEELRVYLRHLEGERELERDALHLLLYLGGQRVAQLLRTTPEDTEPLALLLLVEKDGTYKVEGTLRLLDRKGRRTKPRVHVLPLPPLARAIVVRRLEAGTPYLFAHDQAALRPEKLSAVVARISERMVEDGVSSAPFQLRDLRRTCETIMGDELNISSDALKYTLSHGFGNVQDKHYRKGDPMKLKRATLEAWARFLTGLTSEKPPSNVSQFPRAS